jgi:hypothetical protein
MILPDGDSRRLSHTGGAGTGVVCVQARGKLICTISCLMEHSRMDELDRRDGSPRPGSTRSPIEWLARTWPNRWWLNRLVYITFAASLLLFWFGPADFTSPFPISVGILWILCFLGRIIVYVTDMLRGQQGGTEEDLD